MSRPQFGHLPEGQEPASPDPYEKHAASHGTLPGTPAVPPVPPPAPSGGDAMGRVFAEMGQALAETEAAPMWRATNHYVDGESAESLELEENPFSKPSRLGRLRQFIADKKRRLKLPRTALLKKPRRELVVRAGIGVLAALAGWGVGAKPWQSAPEIPSSLGAAAVLAKAPPQPDKPAPPSPAEDAADSASAQAGTRRALASTRAPTTVQARASSTTPKTSKAATPTATKPRKAAPKTTAKSTSSKTTATKSTSSKLTKTKKASAK